MTLILPNPGKPLGLGSSTLPLSHCAPYYNCCSSYLYIPSFHLTAQHGKCSKISNTFHVLLSKKMWVISAGIHKILIRIAEKTLIRLLLLKQSDLGLHCFVLAFMAGNWCYQNIYHTYNISLVSINGHNNRSSTYLRLLSEVRNTTWASASLPGCQETCNNLRPCRLVK